jgi:hypothetical protein
VYVYPPDPDARQSVRVHKGEHFFMTSHWSLRQSRQQGQDLGPVFQLAAGKLTQHERMAPDFALVQLSSQGRIAPA